MSDAEQRERQKEIVTADCTTPTDSKRLRNIRGENLRRDDHREDGRNNRSPQNGAKTGAAVFDVGSVRGIATAANLEHFSAGDALRRRLARSRYKCAPLRRVIRGT